MESIQIVSLSVAELQQMLDKCAQDAANKAVAHIMAVKHDPNEELTVADLADMFHCSKHTIYRRIKGHKISTVKVGRDIAVKRKFLDLIKKPVVTDK
ncbi:excisionase family DNA binding protein [Chitinophaga polysaccharea]|uniref:Excisionase family DNA binding protein n=1 Tax=Chitinophaga polysaccharea TaxID=1293035 RepID=A0A561PL43_9BACT|nr:helix-turn-helix domain-containing protein [Chitinophaga polysaccharea]TWF38828.1 excisionase family DNA binding protein [Chitinophaga polysaccharea]